MSGGASAMYLAISALRYSLSRYFSNPSRTTDAGMSPMARLASIRIIAGTMPPMKKRANIAIPLVLRRFRESSLWATMPTSRAVSMGAVVTSSRARAQTSDALGRPPLLHHHPRPALGREQEAPQGDPRRRPRQPQAQARQE